MYTTKKKFATNFDFPVCLVHNEVFTQILKNYHETLQSCCSYKNNKVKKKTYQTSL